MPDTVQVKENKLTVLKVDERVNTTFVCEVKNRLGVGKDQVTAVVRGRSQEASDIHTNANRGTRGAMCTNSYKGKLALGSWCLKYLSLHMFYGKCCLFKLFFCLRGEVCLVTFIAFPVVPI